jgi:hypothetical protein
MKARLFLNEKVMQRTWIYISIAGASFAVSSLVRFTVGLASVGNILNTYYMVEITQILFLMSFFIAVYNWYAFTDSLKKKNTGMIERNQDASSY